MRIRLFILSLLTVCLIYFLKTANSTTNVDSVMRKIYITPLQTKQLAESDTGAERENYSECCYCVGLPDGHMESFLFGWV